MSKYKLDKHAKWIIIGIIIICLLLILFKPQIMKWITSIGNPSTTRRLEKSGLEEDFENFEDETEPTDIGTPADMTTTTTTTTTRATTPNNMMSSVQSQTLNSLTNYPFTMAGYNPLLDLVMTRIILLQIWKDDMAELQKTGLPRATPQAASDGAEQENDSIDVETFADLENDDTLYPQIYATFEDFFVAEFQNIPRLNIFIPRITSPNITREMIIILSTFAKPNWIIKITKFSRTEKVDSQTLNEFLNELSGDIPDDREGNPSNLVMNGDISGIAFITVPIKLRKKIDNVRAVLSQYVFNLDYEADPEMAPGFSKQTISLLKFIASNPTLVQLLYMRLNDDETIEMLGLNTSEKDEQLKPKLVSDNRRMGAVGFANLLGYKSSMLYNITLLTMVNQRMSSGQSGSSLLMKHTMYIQRLTKQSVLQNPGIGLAIPDTFILNEKLTTITDNIYSYYFDINSKYSKNYGEAFSKSGIFEFRLKPFLLPIYMDLPNYYLLLATKENALKELGSNISSNTSSNASSDAKLALEKEIDTIKKNINSLAKTTPHMIYLPLYDFQYIKIVLRQTKGELPVPDVYLYPDTKDKSIGFGRLLSRKDKRKLVSSAVSMLGKKEKNISLSSKKKKRFF